MKFIWQSKLVLSTQLNSFGKSWKLDTVVMEIIKIDFGMSYENHLRVLGMHPVEMSWLCVLWDSATVIHWWGWTVPVIDSDDLLLMSTPPQPVKDAATKPDSSCTLERSAAADSSLDKLLGCNLLDSACSSAVRDSVVQLWLSEEFDTIWSDVFFPTTFWALNLEDWFVEWLDFSGTFCIDRWYYAIIVLGR